MRKLGNSDERIKKISEKERKSKEEKKKEAISFSSGNRGSLSVEASIVMPIFLFAVLAIILMCNAIAVKGIIYEAGVETSEYMSEYAYLADKEDMADAASFLVATAKFHEYIDDSELVKDYITGGTMGISLLGSSFPDEEGYIRLKVTYHLGINAPLFGKFSKLCTYEIKEKAYLGYDVKNCENETDDDDIYVYLADNSAVYHMSRSCTYLHYNISRVSLASAKADRRGKCEYCGKYTDDEVYITEYGDKYHSSLSCSRLARNVRRVKLSEAKKAYPPCSKCGN